MARTLIDFLRQRVGVVQTDMPANLLLMCKLYLLLLWKTDFLKFATTPFLPFFSVLGIFQAWPEVYTGVLRGLLIGSGVLVFLNVRVRLMAILFGSLVIWIILSSKTHFRNHLLIVGCLVFLAGLSSRNKPPILLYWQFSLVYFGAGINKMLSADWWNGQFMTFWLTESAPSFLFKEVSEWFPEGAFAKGVSISTIGIEFVLGISLLLDRWRRFGIWLALIFHCLIFAFTGGGRFGHFLESILIGMLVFVPWQSERRVILWGAPWNGVRFLDWDRQFIWPGFSQEASKDGLSLTIISGIQALKQVLLYCTGVPFLLAGIYWTSLEWVGGLTWVIGVLCLSFALLLLFFPLDLIRHLFRRKDREIG